MIQLLNVDRMKAFINAYYGKRLKKAVEEQDETWKLPILFALLLVQGYKIFRLALIIMISSYFIGIIWFIIVCDFLPEKYDYGGTERVGFAVDYLNSC